MFVVYIPEDALSMWMANASSPFLYLRGIVCVNEHGQEFVGYNRLGYIFNIPHPSNCNKYDFLYFTQIQE